MAYINRTPSSLDHRNEFALNLAYFLLLKLPTLRTMYGIRYQGHENLDALDYASRRTGCFFLPKHQLHMDIPLVGLGLMDYGGIFPLYIMKTTLPGWLKPLGGIPIIRARDLRIRHKARLEQAKKRRDHIYGEVPKILYYGESMVVFPEGTRRWGQVINLRDAVPRGNLSNLLKTQQRVQDLAKDPSIRVPFVPIDIRYTGKSVAGYAPTPGSRITVTFKPAVQVPNDGLDQLIDHLVEHVEMFTG